jgi:hypothetical protein
MQSNNIPTAEEFLSTYSIEYGDSKNNSRAIVKASEATNALIEFAKLHVKSALEAASDNATIDDIGSPNGDGEWMYCGIVDKDSILNSYPLENIK